MRVGYFGGSFDPPHTGHLTVARAAQRHFALDEVLLAPTGRQPLKPDGPAAPFTDRLAMVGLLCAGDPSLHASAVDAPHADGTPNYTLDALRHLRTTLPPHAELFAVVGADAFLTLPQWHQAAQLFDSAEWIVVSRPGASAERIASMPLTVSQRARTHLLEGIADPTSATDLRSQLRTHRTCVGLLPQPICDYIQTHCLYGSQDGGIREAL